MPNWCYTQHYAEGNKEALAQFAEKLKMLTESKKEILPNGFGINWLGNIVHLFGGDPEEVSCRGELLEFEVCNDHVYFCALYAWNESAEFMAFLESKLPSLKIYFFAEEDGMGYYATNDTEEKYFSEKYLVMQEGEEYMYSDEELLSGIAERIGQPVNTADEIKEKIEAWNNMQENENDKIRVYARKLLLDEANDKTIKIEMVEL